VCTKGLYSGMLGKEGVSGEEGGVVGIGGNEEGTSALAKIPRPRDPTKSANEVRFKGLGAFVLAGMRVRETLYKIFRAPGGR
jgi:hypothetical protein